MEGAVADWFGNHREFYVLFVLFSVAALWLATGMMPVRKLIRAWQGGHPVPHGLVRRGMAAVSFGVFGLFAVSQMALASQHLLPHGALNEYMVWFAGAIIFPLMAQWAVWRLARRHLIINPIYDDEFTTEVKLPWRGFAVVAVALLSLPITELVGFDQPLGWAMPVLVLAVGAMWLRSNRRLSRQG